MLDRISQVVPVVFGRRFTRPIRIIVLRGKSRHRVFFAPLVIHTESLLAFGLIRLVGAEVAVHPYEISRAVDITVNLSVRHVIGACRQRFGSYVLSRFVVRNPDMPAPTDCTVDGQGYQCIAFHSGRNFERDYGLVYIVIVFDFEPVPVHHLIGIAPDQHRRHVFGHVGFAEQVFVLIPYGECLCNGDADFLAGFYHDAVGRSESRFRVGNYAHDAGIIDAVVFVVVRLAVAIRTVAQRVVDASGRHQ